MTRRKTRVGGRPPVAKLPKNLTARIRKHVRETLAEHGLSRADFDEMLEQNERFTDNALNQGEQLPVKKAKIILTALWTRFRSPLSFAYLEQIRIVTGGLNLPLPMIMPKETVRNLADAFERYAINETSSRRSEAAFWTKKLVDFLEEIRYSSDSFLKMELSRIVRHVGYKVDGVDIEPDAFDRAIRLASVITEASPAENAKFVQALNLEKSAKT